MDVPPSRSDICWTCFCPGITIGRMHSHVTREKEIVCLDMGWGGGALCCETCTCAAFGWPLSPFLACYVCIQTYHLSKIYPDEATWTCSNDCFGILWPWALNKNQRLLNYKRENGILHYNWAYKSAHRTLGQIDEIVENKKVLYIIGPPGCGKSTLMRKLCKTIGEHKTRASGNMIDIGYARILDSEYGPFLLEVWDIPHELIEACSSHSPNFVMFVYDSGNRESFSNMQMFYEDFSTVWVNCQKLIVVANKIDTWDDDNDNARDSFGIDTTQWRSSCIEMAIDADQWAKVRGLEFNLVSCPMNEGILKLLRKICYGDVK
jgi:energy-coupling factor transporter ATP-binding protein EcfA2